MPFLQMNLRLTMSERAARESNGASGLPQPNQHSTEPDLGCDDVFGVEGL